MTPLKLFCFGYGYTAQALAAALKAENPHIELAGTTRDFDKMRALKAEGVKAYVYDNDHPLDDPFHALDGVTHVLLSVPPDDNGDTVFIEHAEDLLRIDTIQWVGLLSTTGVYGDRNGEWVDETAEMRPTSKRGSRRALAESQWLSLFAGYRFPVHVFRLAGIYGPGRCALDAVRAGNSRRIYKPGHAFNRVHVDDIVQTLMASMAQPHAGSVYNVSDDYPSPSHEVIAYACTLLGMQVPPLISFDEVDQAPMARSFYLDNKRVRNDKIKAELGVKLKYPDFKSGLDACYEAERSNRTPLSFFLGHGDQGG